MRLRRVPDRRAALARQPAEARGKRLCWPEIVSFGLVGVSLGAAVIVGVQVLSRTDGASMASADARLTPIAAPIPVLTTKENPLRAPSLFAANTNTGTAEQASLIKATYQRVARDGKGDLPPDNPLFTSRAIAAAPTETTTPAQPRSAANKRAPLPKLAATPPIWKLEESWRLARGERLRLLAQRRKRLRERMCLAKAIYFEARSESIKGQMAVTKVILNRVRDPRFPSTICGVVYQGAERRNACQFSFACDGKPDYPTDARQWAIAKRLATKAMRGQIRLRGFEGVAFYHADYVRPTWASVMRPVIKIGRHIFYRDS